MFKVSVIIPIYNVEKYLAECLDSICGQTLRDIEIICVNDGATDNSPKILEDYAQKDSRIKIITQENQGLAGARNAGIPAAGGEYIYFMDSDDMLEKDALETLYQKCQTENLDIIYFNSRVIYESSEMARKYRWHQDFRMNGDYLRPVSGQELFINLQKNDEYFISPVMQMLRREYLRKNNLIFPLGLYHEDILFNLQSLLSAQKVCVLNKDFFIRRVRVGSIMTTVKNHRNFYGYFVSYVRSLTFLQEHSNELMPEIKVWAIKEIEKYLDSAISIYDLLPCTEKNKIPSMISAEEEIYFTKSVLHGHKMKRFMAWSLRKIKDIIRLCCKK